jgi:predicted lipid-binding transport protein (Tim44 family)
MLETRRNTILNNNAAIQAASMQAGAAGQAGMMGMVGGIGGGALMGVGLAI